MATCRYGPRVKMGIYEGVPTHICPHSTSGRCDYWGPFVNRAARYGHAGAHGGQVLMPVGMARKLVLSLTGQCPMLEGADPTLLVHPNFVPKRLEVAEGQGTGQGLAKMHSSRFKEQRRTAEVRRFGRVFDPWTFVSALHGYDWAVGSSGACFCCWEQPRLSAVHTCGVEHEHKHKHRYNKAKVGANSV